MNQIILTTPEELRAIVSESVSQTLAGLTLPKDEPDNLTPDAAVVDSKILLCYNKRKANGKYRLRPPQAGQIEEDIGIWT